MTVYPIRMCGCGGTDRESRHECTGIQIDTCQSPEVLLRLERMGVEFTLDMGGQVHGCFKYGHFIERGTLWI